MASSLKLYAEARERIHHTLAGVSRNWPEVSADKPIVFHGGGEVAEIGYVCLHETDLRLIGVIDDARTTPFFGVPVLPIGRLAPLFWVAPSNGRIVVMSFADHAHIRETLDERGIPSGLVEWI